VGGAADRAVPRSRRGGVDAQEVRLRDGLGRLLQPQPVDRPLAAALRHRTRCPGARRRRSGRDHRPGGQPGQLPPLLLRGVARAAAFSGIRRIPHRAPRGESRRGVVSFRSGGRRVRPPRLARQPDPVAGGMEAARGRRDRAGRDQGAGVPRRVERLLQPARDAARRPDRVDRRGREESQSRLGSASPRLVRARTPPSWPCRAASSRAAHGPVLARRAGARRAARRARAARRDRRRMELEHPAAAHQGVRLRGGRARPRLGLGRAPGPRDAATCAVAWRAP
jgi:hypothetical protein